jgi:hypothetical protein
LILTTENEAVIPINWYTTSKPTLNYQLTIINNRGYIVYYKITTPDKNLVLSNNTGPISAAATSTIMFKIYFPIPSGPQDYIVNLNLELYSDSSYSNLIDSGSFTLVVHFIDLNTVNKIAYWDFSDGTTQGWTGVSVDRTAFASPYSIYSWRSGAGTIQVQSPSITLPSTGNIWLIFAYKSFQTITTRLALSFGSTLIKEIKYIRLDTSQWFIFAIKITKGLGTTDKFYISADFPDSNTGFFDDIYLISL